VSIWVPVADWAALIVFMLCWLFYSPFVEGRGRSINQNMHVVRRHWMAMMVKRDNRFMDANLMGHVLNTASFFASTNLLIIAAVIGALFGGDQTWKAISSFSILAKSSHLVFDIKLALVILTLARGLLDFIWGIRQINYFLAVIGAAPVTENAEYAKAAAALLDPAMSSVNKGVRAYYFALAAATWLLSPYAAVAATVGAVLLLANRQYNSDAARAVQRVRALLDQS
jgi:uncharacterized membrane protein